MERRRGRHHRRGIPVRVRRRLGLPCHLGRAQGLRPHPGPARPHSRRAVRPLQSLADGIKLLSKEDFTPTGADRFLFKLAPYLAFCASFVGFLALPFGNDLVGRNLNVAAFFMLAVLSSEVFGVVLAGYASASKWSLFGGVREAAQVVSYEVPRAMCVVVPVCVAGTLNLNTIGVRANRLVLELEPLPRPVHLRRLLHLLHHGHGQLQARAVRPG